MINKFYVLVYEAIFPREGGQGPAEDLLDVRITLYRIRDYEKLIRRPRTHEKDGVFTRSVQEKFGQFAERIRKIGVRFDRSDFLLFQRFSNTVLM